MTEDALMEIDLSLEHDMAIADAAEAASVAVVQGYAAEFIDPADRAAFFAMVRELLPEA